MNTGDMFGDDYRLLGLLGRGGMGEVHRAQDLRHDRIVALKLLPENILLTSSADAAGRDFAYLTDFGIARERGDLAPTSVTQAGTAVGTVAYMAPERWTSSDVDGRADVYSLACVLHECLTGRPPFPSENPVAIIDAHRYSLPPRPSVLVPGLPAGLEG